MSSWSDSADPSDAERYAIARLLQARGENHAAAIVALSGYHATHVDNWDGGQYEAVLAVPPEFYDLVTTDEFGAAIDKAAEDVIGTVHYAGLNVRVSTAQPASEWVAEVVASLRTRRVTSERVDESQPAISGIR